MVVRDFAINKKAPSSWNITDSAASTYAGGRTYFAALKASKALMVASSGRRYHREQ